MCRIVWTFDIYEELQNTPKREEERNPLSWLPLHLHLLVLGLRVRSLFCVLLRDVDKVDLCQRALGAIPELQVHNVVEIIQVWDKVASPALLALLLYAVLEVGVLGNCCASRAAGRIVARKLLVVTAYPSVGGVRRVQLGIGQGAQTCR